MGPSPSKDKYNFEYLILVSWLTIIVLVLDPARRGSFGQQLP